MRWLVRGLIVGVFSLLILGALALWLALDAEPALNRSDLQMSPADVARVRKWAADADPRRSSGGVPRTLFASARDLDLLANDISRRVVRGSARVEILADRAVARFSAPLPRVPGRWWMNWRVVLLPRPSGLPEVDSIHVGGLRVPAGLAGFAVNRVMVHYDMEQEWGQALSMVQGVQLSPAGVRISYLWQPGFEDRLRQGLVPPPMQDALHAYSERLAELVQPSAGLPAHRPVSLAHLLLPMFELARQRSAAYALGRGAQDSGEGIRAHAAMENRAALISLALYAAQRPVTKLVPAARNWRLPAPREVLLSGRPDYPQHLLISAVLAAEGGGRLADAIGMYKEISDSKDGSGFSFDDLAADRAGTRIGQRAVHDPIGLQTRLTEAAEESDVMPSVTGLPSFLPEAEFRKQFGRIGSPAYNQVAREIEQRVQKLPVNQ